MKRIFKYFIGIIILLVIASPYVAGMFIEKKYNAMLEQLNTIGKDEVKFVGKFQRGFFSSTATTEITLKNSLEPLQLAHFIKHGPVIFHASGWFHPSSYIPHGFALAQISTSLTGEIEKMLENAYAGKPAYDVTTNVTLHGDVNTDINSYPINTNAGTSKLDWQGLQAAVNTNVNLDKVSINATVPLINYSETTGANVQQSAHVADIKISFNDSFVTHDSTLNISVENSKIVSNTTNDLNVDNFTINVNRNVVNGLMDVDFKLGFTKLDLAALVYGPLTFSFQAKNLNAEAIYEAMQPEAQAHVQEQTKIPPSVLIKLLSHKIDIDSNLNFTTPDGNINMVSHTEAGDPSLASLSPNQEPPADKILPTITAKHTIQVSKKLAMKILSSFAENQVHHMEAMYYMMNKTSTIKNPYTMTPQQLQTTVQNWVTKILDQLTQQNYITQKDAIISSTINYANSTFTVNGVTKSKADLDQLNALFVVVQPPVAPIAPAATTPSTAETPPVAETPTTGSATPNTESATPSTTINTSSPPKTEPKQ